MGIGGFGMVAWRRKTGRYEGMKSILNTSENLCQDMNASSLEEL